MAFSKIAGYNKKGMDTKQMPKCTAFIFSIFFCWRCFVVFVLLRFPQQHCVKNNCVIWISRFIILFSLLV